MSNFKTIYQEAEVTEIVKKSKFISYVKPVESVEEANEFINVIKKKHWNASHNVPVYVLGDNFQVQKFSDDGEPSGTAGLPILDILKKEGITNVVVVVTRYFGGVKLGTGGLVRAYSHCAKLALEEARIIEMVEYQSVSVIISYTLNGKFQNFINLNHEYLLDETIYAEDVEVKLLVKTDEVEQFRGKVVDLTSDNCEVILNEIMMLPISNGEWVK